MIASRVVNQLKLEQVGKLKFDGMNGETWRPSYLFHVAFYDVPPLDGGEQVSKIHICRKVINGGELTHEHTFDVLLGMDILTTGEFRLSRDGTFRFTF
jgi:hypothetical protein